MKSVGIITIHNIYNYGSVFQAYALQKKIEQLGYKTEIINYVFPNEFHKSNPYAIVGNTIMGEPKLIKALFAPALFRQHKGITRFVNHYQNLTTCTYSTPDELKITPPHYDVYVTGSDQLWSPRHCNGDPAFMLHFAPSESLKISYAASFGTNEIPSALQKQYEELLGKYKHISVRENSGVSLIKDLTGKEAEVVLDPTLLLTKDEWNQIATPKRQFKKKYVLCYFLNYSFDSFPYVETLAQRIQEQTGYEIVYVARPPHQLFNKHTYYRVGASPEVFLALIRDAEMILTTSFHGTAFAVNYGKPFFTIVENRNAKDSRQLSLIQNLGLDKQVLTITDDIPQYTQSEYDVVTEQKCLEELREESLQYISNALNYE